MDQPPTEHQKLLRDVDRLLAEARDDETRLELTRLRERLSAPEMLDMVRAVQASPRPRSADLVLEFHDSLLPAYVTASGGVIATAVCLFAVVASFESTVGFIADRPLNLWLMAAIAGTFSVMFTALSFMRTFSVRFDTEGMISRPTGRRWRLLRVGAMSWKEIRSLHERAADRVLEVRAANGAVFEIPLRVVNYPILRAHLDNMVRLYGDRA